MEILRTQRVSFTYPNEIKPAISEINLTIQSGEIVVLCGASGSGKTTLLRQLKKEIRMQGVLEGRIFFQGEDLEKLSPLDSASKISYLFQNPQSQIVMDTVRGEIAFSLENLGLQSAQIRRRIGEIVGYFGIGHLLSASTGEISGGETQLVNLCSLLAQRPALLLLDEPLSQLDPIAQSAFIDIISRINRDLGVTIVVAEHCTEDLMAIADKLIIMEEGKILHDSAPLGVAQKVFSEQHNPYQGFFPVATALSYLGGGLALTVRDAKKILQSANLQSKKSKELEGETRKKTWKAIEAVIAAKGICFQYSKHSPMILEGLDIVLEQGDFAAVLGANGVGKSTLIQILAGLLKPLEGKISYGGRAYGKLGQSAIASMIGYVPQDPRLTFTCDSVLEELNLATNEAMDKHQEEYMKDLFDGGFDFTQLYHRHPYDLSGGETQRLALYCALLRGQKVLLLDEVTKGLDPMAKETISKLLRKLSESGITILMVTHDIEFSAKNAKKFAMIFDGGITSWQNKFEFFNSNFFYTTAVKRIYGESRQDLVSLDDLQEGGGIC